MRHVLFVAAGFAALMVLALGANASHKATPTVRSIGLPIGLVSPHVGAKRVVHFKASRPGLRGAGGTGFDAFHASTKKDNMTNGTGVDQIGAGPGQTMRTNTVYAIYWVPSGYSLPASYQTTIDEYFSDVAADSGSKTNVYSSTTQYFDPNGHIAYDSTFAGSAVDTQAFPTSDCELPSTVIGATECMSDNELQTEVKRFADAQGWPNGRNTEFFLSTPHNVGSCFYTEAEAGDPSNNVCSYDWYCAYHNAFLDTGDHEYVYANMPFPNQEVDFTAYGAGIYPSDCDSGEHPNGDGTADSNDANAADEVLSVTSHEHNESITDPEGLSWWDDNPNDPLWYGSENGDLCAWSWLYPKGPAGVLGGDYTQGTAYNQSINGDHYFIQGEWSNANATTAGWSGCVWNMLTKADKPVIDSFGPAGGPVGTSVTINGSNLLTAKSVKFNGKPASFQIQSDGEITATVPVGANSGKISVTTGAGTITSADSFSVLQIKAFGPPKGGSSSLVTITGSGFTGATEVDFNGTPTDTPPTVVSDTTITVNPPAGGTSGPISVVTPLGTAMSAKSFGYVPSISSFSPVSGIGGGSPITVSGSHFTGASLVKIGSRSVVFSVDNDGQITIPPVPGNVTTGKISVTTPGGTAMSSTPWTLIAVKSISPLKGLHGTLVTITGSGFMVGGAATGVNFGITPGESLNVISDTKLTVVVPCMNSGMYTVSVGTPNGTATYLKSNFTITQTCS